MNTKAIVFVASMMMFSSGAAMAYGYGYDPVDANAQMQQNQISAQEQYQVAREMREGDYGHAQRIIQRDEAMKAQIRQNEAMYDRARDMGYGGGYGNQGNGYGNGYGNQYGYGRY
jgi:hypothetical protein